ncbi:hypothetical protein BJ875DRAFT_249165 [Amylocarpus encephaloides]|uniref:Ketoreductase domain-containing protein n=1 Tax=Amylocarpus encephaloides TaxID=45428 RepID=A0A9P7YMV1_9HELO|nr:hypothetical protein BJ875DRAFT_249165 [Amylocarpus encephaloides]
MSFTNKTVLITGGSKGIGRAISLHLASQGANVIINYASSAKDADDVVEQIGGERAVAIKADAGDVGEIGRLVEEGMKWKPSGGKIDILVACAGTMRLTELNAVTEEDYDATFNLNVRGSLFLAQKAAPYMQQGSRIILFSTTQAKATTVTGNYLTYCMSKGAVEQMTRVLSKDLARKGITVNCVAPGPTATDLFLLGKSEALLQRLASLNPQNRFGRPGEIAEVVASLAGPGGAWVSGQVLYVNGGQA